MSRHVLVSHPLMSSCLCFIARLIKRTLLLSQLCPSVTLVIYAKTVEYIVTCCAPVVKVMFLVFRGQISPSTNAPVKSDNFTSTPRYLRNGARCDTN